MTEIKRVCGRDNLCPAGIYDQSPDPCNVCETCGYCSNSCWSNGYIYVCITLGEFCSCVEYPKINERLKKKEDRAIETARVRQQMIIPMETLTKGELIDILMYYFRKQGRRYSYTPKTSLTDLRNDIVKNKINTQLIREKILADKLNALEEIKQKEEAAKILEELIKKRSKTLWKNKAVWVDTYVKFIYGKVTVLTDEMKAKRKEQREAFIAKIARDRPYEEINENTIRINYINYTYNQYIFYFTEEIRQEKIEYFSTEGGFHQVVRELCKKDSKMPKRVIRCLPDNKAIIYSLKW